MRSAAARPVTASMRRRPAPIDVSPVMMMAPTSPDAWTWVPPQSSWLKQSLAASEVADADDAHDVGVLVAEEGQGAVRQRLLVALVLDVDAEVLAHDLVRQRLDLAQLRPASALRGG